MSKMHFRIIAVSFVMGLLVIGSGVGQADTLSEGHRKVSGVVTAIKGDFVTVKTVTGSLMLNQKNARDHGHAEYKNGDEVTIVMDENNDIIEAHHKGEEGHHHFYTGKLVYMGKMKKEIKLETIDGEKVFPLDRLEIKTKNLEEGTVVTVEVNEGGKVIDLHRGSHGEASIHAMPKSPQ
ncbi:hypothetical protein ACTRXD_14920 [Nitrospira sp. T9]|uniref:hypothetical protein n=1 Tax=unclassified Nitrospira TaxID=2652172 RepID=UPI003F97008F